MRSGLKTIDIRNIITSGVSVRKRTISIKYLAGNDYRYSVVVTKKQGNAVQRNRVKRVIREIMRTRKNLYPRGEYLLYFNQKCEDFQREPVSTDINRIIRALPQ